VVGGRRKQQETDMRPDEIQSRDFLVGLRGYDKDEVRAFLDEVASEHAAVLAELEEARIMPAPEPVTVTVTDDLDSLGIGVAAILRTARESAAELTGTAEQQAAALRDEAEQHAANLRSEADAHATRVREDAERRAADLREETEAWATALREEAERVLAEATERARQLEIETEARVNNRIDDATRREAAIRTRLSEAYDELQLALSVLDDTPVSVDVRDDATDMVEAEEAAAWS
jgi:DivIVA domain-containing protein